MDRCSTSALQTLLTICVTMRKSELAEGEQPSSPWNRRLPKSTMGYWKRRSVLLIMLPAHKRPADRARCLTARFPPWERPLQGCLTGGPLRKLHVSSCDLFRC